MVRATSLSTALGLDVRGALYDVFTGATRPVATSYPERVAWMWPAWYLHTVGQNRGRASLAEPEAPVTADTVFELTSDLPNERKRWQAAPGGAGSLGAAGTMLPRYGGPRSDHRLDDPLDRTDGGLKSGVDGLALEDPSEVGVVLQEHRRCVKHH